MSTPTADVRGLSREAPSGRIPAPKHRLLRRMAVPALLAAAVVALLIYANQDSLWPAVEVRALPVVVKSTTGDTPGTVTVQAPGWIEPAPFPHYVTALTPGVVAELLVLEGEAVEKGQVVARLVDDDARIAHDRAAAVVAERRAAIAEAEADLDATRQTLETLVDLDEGTARAEAAVAAARSRRTRLDAEIEASEALVLATEDEFERKRPLAATEAVSRGEVERLRLRLDAERAGLAATRAGTGVLDAELASAEAQLAAARERAELRIAERRAVALARARLEAARAALQRAEADLQDASLRLERTQVRAPAAGIAMGRIVAPGSEVGVGKEPHSAHVLHLYDPDRLQVRVDVPLADAARVGVEQQAEVVVEALPDRVFAGTVTRLVHEADIAKNTVEVKVSIDDPDATLKPEMLARVRFLGRAEQTQPSAPSARQRVFAPEAALRQVDGRPTVIVVAAPVEGLGRAEPRAVEPGSQRLDGYVEIRSGLRPGDLVVVDGPADLAEGTRIRIANGGDS